MAKFLSLEGLTTIIAKLKSQFAAKGEAIKSITGSGNRTISYLRADNTQGSFSYQDTTYGTGNTSTAGITKLYTSLGTQTDGAPTNNLLNSQVSTLNTAIGDKLDKDSIVQTTGTATDKVMSQKSVTDALDFMKNMQTDVVVKEDADAAFDIADESGRVALRITSKGHIKTKCFDSENMDIFRTTKLDSPQCVCHGYGSVSKQANTIEYFRAGYAAGYRFFECDAVNCSDGIPVCTHQYNTITVYAKDTHEATTIAMQKVNDAWTIQMSSTELVQGYTWDSAGNVPIALLSEVIWQVCYFYRCPLHVDGQGLNKASRLAASQYAESLGVGQYVFHELSAGAYTDWHIPCNAIIYASSVADIQTKAASYKKADNNIIFYLAQGAAAATIKSLADAAHEAGCYLMSWTFGSAASAREWFVNGTDFIITSNSITNNKI